MSDLFAPAWAALETDDAALARRFAADRGVRIVPAIDADETRAERIDGVLEGCFELVGETHALPDPIDWLTNPSRDVEWHIMLHKFYYAVGLGLAYERSGDPRYRARWMALIDGWIAAVPPGFIAADVTGRRVQNWIYSLGFFTREALPGAFLRRLLQSLAAQVEFLCANLTPKRNHRTLELTAIFLAGVALPELARAAHWRRFALDAFVTNLVADVLPDGVHCELSTDYHHLVLKNALNVRRLAADHGMAVPAAFDDVLRRMLDFSAQVHRPDGSVPSLSDGDVGSFTDLLQRGAALFGPVAPRRVAHYTASGYTVLRGGRDQHLVFDSGPLGEGNHGHFDALSVELWAHGRPLVVDPGRFTYSEAGPVNWRVHFRHTAAHNTVCVDGLPQTRYVPQPVPPGSRHAAGSTRHRIDGPPADGTTIEVHQGRGVDLVHGCVTSAAYDARHERCIASVGCGEGHYWIVSDWLRAPGLHRYDLHFQFAPDAAGHARLRSAASLRVDVPGLALLLPGHHEAVLLDGWVSPRYGEKLAAPKLRVRAAGRRADFDSVLVPHAGAVPDIEVADEGVGVLRIERTLGGTAVVDRWFHARDGQAMCRIGGERVPCRWAWWREDGQGRLLAFESHAGVAWPRVRVSA
jgi:hypothetical protein